MNEVNKDIKSLRNATILVVCGIIALCAIKFFFYSKKNEQAPSHAYIRIQDNTQPQAIEIPNNDAAYIWSFPDRGHQSLVILNVVDGNTVEAAYLVPVRIKMHHMIAPNLDEKGGKEAKAALEKILLGQMRTAQLWGYGKDGLFADFWISSDNNKGSWASQLMISQEHANSLGK